jgi:hypothetical protein
MSNSAKKLFLVIPVREQGDLEPVVEAEEWHTVRDLLRKTRTSFNAHWNGKYVLDLDERPWRASPEEMEALHHGEGSVVAISDGTYHAVDSIPLFIDSDGSVYVLEDDISSFLQEIGLA